MARSNPPLLLLLLYTLAIVVGLTRCSSGWSLDDDFQESLHLRPLPTGRVQTTFTFTLSSAVDPFSPDSKRGVAFHLLPPSLLTLLHSSPLKVKELHLSFNKGRWDHGRWGMPTFLHGGQEWATEAVASGVEAWIRYAAHLPQHTTSAGMNASTVERQRIHGQGEGRDSFHDLLSSLSGQLCSTLSASGSKEAIASPLTLSRSLYSMEQGLQFPQVDKGEDLIYTLSIPETPCTEVLYRLLALLPCRADAGLTTLLGPHKWLAQEWHGVELVVRRTGHEQRGWQVQVKVGGVWNGVLSNGKRDFSMTSMFGKPLAAACPLAKDSSVTLLAPPLEALDGLTSTPAYEVLPALTAQSELDVSESSSEATAVVTEEDESDQDNSESTLLIERTPVQAAKELHLKGSLSYATTSDSLPAYIRPPVAGRPSGLDVSLSWPEEGLYNYTASPVVEDHTLHVSRSYISSSLTKVKFILRLKNDRPDTSRRLVHREVLPWFLLPSLPSASLSITPLEESSSSPFIRFDSDYTLPQKSLLHLEYIPSIPRVSSGVLEVEFRIPPASELRWEIKVGREVIRYEEHNPDAHRGLEIGAGTAWEIVDNEEEEEVEEGYEEQNQQPGHQVGNWRGMRGSRKVIKLTEGGQRSIYKTEVGLVEVAVPDFSMPYNVIIFTSTLLALFAGSAINLFTRSFKDVAVPPLES